MPHEEGGVTLGLTLPAARMSRDSPAEPTSALATVSDATEKIVRV